MAGKSDGTEGEFVVGIVLFDDAEELDWVGPYEVFTMAEKVAAGQGPAASLRVELVSQDGGKVTGAKGMRVEVDASFESASKPDVVLIPGGVGTRVEMKRPEMLDFVRRAASGCQWLTSVCTGSAVLQAAGLTRGKRITTHWGYIETLRESAGDDCEVLEKVRYVRDGNLVTSAGVSAGIDMSLWLVGQIFGVPHARLTQRMMEYDPAPPYAAEA